MLCRHGPWSRSYWISSTAVARSSLLLTVVGWPLRRIVIPHEAGGMTAFAATEASSDNASSTGEVANNTCASSGNNSSGSATEGFRVLASDSGMVYVSVPARRHGSSETTCRSRRRTWGGNAREASASSLYRRPCSLRDDRILAVPQDDRPARISVLVSMYPRTMLGHLHW